MLIHVKEEQVRRYKEVAMDRVYHTKYCLVFAQLPFLNKQKALIQESMKEKKKKKNIMRKMDSENVRTSRCHRMTHMLQISKILSFPH